MKKLCIFFLLSIIISVTALGLTGAFAAEKNGDTGEYLRIHIRADSNETEAQAVKYRVRDDVVAYLTPIVASCESKAEAISALSRQLDEIVRVANKTLTKYGLGYTATADIREETFPTRVYDGYTLPSGKYTALIIGLGKAEGDNWWCVVYPPLCFSAPTGKNVVYKSKIAEIIRNWQAKQ